MDWFKFSTYLFLALSMACCVAFCVLRAKKANVLSLAFKTISSVFFILGGIFALKVSNVFDIAQLLIIAGLVFGLVGDIILDLKIMYPEKSDAYFTFGTLSFAFGHVFYFVSALLVGKAVTPDNIWWCLLASVGVAAVLTTAIVLSSKTMKLDFGKHLPLVIIYTAILTFMVSFTISIAIFAPIYWIFASGMICFFLSDLVLSMQYFGGRSEKVWIYVNHILYYAAQILLALSIALCFA